MIIKAGTYRFNDVLTAQVGELTQTLSFTCATVVDGTHLSLVGEGMRVFLGDGTGAVISVSYTITEAEGADYPEGLLPYDFIVSEIEPGSNGWRTDVYGEGVQIITIPTDSEVSAEFYEWFTANAVEVVPKVIKAGTYRFNDVLTLPSESEFFEQPIDFSFTAYSDYTGQATIICYAIVTGYNEYMQYHISKFICANGREIPGDTNFPIYHAWDDGYWTTDFDEGVKTITIPTDSEVSDEFYEWFTANSTEVVQHTISGVWKFKDVLGAPSEALYQEVVFETSPAISETVGGLVDGTMAWNIFEVVLEDGTMGVLYAPNADHSYPPFYYSNYGWDYWAAATGNDDFEGFGQTIDFGTEPQSVSAEFYAWLTENANPVVEETPIASIHYNGTTIASLFGGQTATVKLKGDGVQVVPDIVVEVAEVSGGDETGSDFIAENFPSDTWSDGEYTGTIEGISVTMRYKYRTGNTDPKNISFAGTMEDVLDGNVVCQITNLAEFYLMPILASGLRFYINEPSGTGTATSEQIELGEILLFNPVVPTYFDLSDYISAAYGMTVDLTLTATQCAMHNYEGENTYVTTAVTYVAKSNAIEVYGQLAVKALHRIPQYCEWHYEVGIAYGGKDTMFLANYDAKHNSNV